MTTILTTRAQSFLIDGIDFSGQASSAAIQSEDGMKAWTSGGLREWRQYTINITAGQDLTAASLWTLMFTRTNEDVPIILKPYGNNDAPSAEKPWVKVTAQVSEPTGDMIGGDADTSTTTKRTFAVSWTCDRPTLLTSAWEA